MKAEDGLSQAGEGKGIPQREAVRDDRRGMDGAQDFRRVAGDEKESAPRLESGPAGVRGKDPKSAPQFQRATGGSERRQESREARTVGRNRQRRSWCRTSFSQG